MILYRAKILVGMDGPPIGNGGILVDGDTISAAGKYSDLAAHHSGDTVDLGEVILMPGLINAHCHLEFGLLPSSLSNSPSFTQWIKQINANKRSLGEEDFYAATIRGSEELLRNGVTTIVNIASTPEMLARLPALPQRVWWCHEMLDIRLREHSVRSMLGSLAVFGSPANETPQFALSPHAPYTASLELYRLAQAAAQRCHLLLTTHVAESYEEMEMFRDGSGPLFDFLAGLGRNMCDCRHATPLAHLINKGGLNPEALLVHLNELTAEDFDLLSDWTSRRTFHVVHCPKSHQFFQHTRFPFEMLVERGACVSLGTDSLASNDSLDLFAEMRCFAELHPDIAPEEIVKMVTLNPAKSLQQQGRLGVLRAGAKADAFAIPLDADGEVDIYELILNHSSPIEWLMIDGKPPVVGPNAINR